MTLLIAKNPKAVYKSVKRIAQNNALKTNVRRQLIAEEAKSKKVVVGYFNISALKFEVLQ